MGILTEYYRAPDDATAVLAAELGPDVASPPHPAYDVVPAKGLDALVSIGQLLAQVRGEAWHVRLVQSAQVHPGPDAPKPDGGPADEDNPWVTGPWIERLPEHVRDTLADLADAELPALAAWWATTEELARWDPADLGDVLTSLVGLSRTARAAGESLYCWTSL